MESVVATKLNLDYRKKDITAWEILYKQQGKKQNHVSAIRKDNRTTKDKHGGLRQCFAASNNSLSPAPGENRIVFWGDKAWKG